MSSTLTVQNTINFAAPYIKNRPLTIGVVNEPALSIANTLLQTIIGPPFCWPWNRNTLTLTATTQDTTQNSVADFGFIENAAVTDTNNIIYQLNVKTCIPVSADVGRPRDLAVQMQVPGSGTTDNITFRTDAVQSGSTTIKVVYQKKAALFTAPSATWAPIPDQFSYLYNYGFLALAMAFADDTRFTIFNQKFIGHLLGAAQGLDETQKNIFLGNWMTITGQTNALGLKVQQGYQGRGV